MFIAPIYSYDMTHLLPPLVQMNCRDGAHSNFEM